MSDELTNKLISYTVKLWLTWLQFVSSETRALNPMNLELQRKTTFLSLFKRLASLYTRLDCTIGRFRLGTNSPWLKCLQLSEIMVSSIAEQFADNNVTISKWLADLDEKNSLGHMWFIVSLLYVCFRFKHSWWN